MERYRSGHNEAVLKTVCPKGREGSNPTLSVLEKYPSWPKGLPWKGSRSKYPSWPKGLPWKGSRSLVAARGFKSLLLRSILSIKNYWSRPVVFLNHGVLQDRYNSVNCKNQENSVVISCKNTIYSAGRKNARNVEKLVKNG